MHIIEIPTETEIKQWVRETFLACLTEFFSNDAVIPKHAEDEQLLTRKEIAGVFRVSLVTLHEWMNAGLPYHKQGGRVYFLRSEVMAYLKKKKGKVVDMAGTAGKQQRKRA